MAEGGYSDFPIQITSFINPHLFYFKLENIVGEYDSKLENHLRLNAENAEIKKLFNPSKGEIISAYIPSWSKWLRGQVDLVLNENGTNQYIIWCLDYGLPMKVTNKYLRPIPMGFQNLPPSIFIGGLAKCAPIDKKLNFAKMIYETRNMTDFPEYLVSNAKQIIEESVEINFTPRQKMGEHIFGDMIITKYSGAKINFVDELVKTGNVKIIDEYIPKDIEEMLSTKKNRYENHSGHLNIRIESNEALKARSDPVKSFSTKKLNEEDELILVWSRQNNELAKKMEQDTREYFNRVINQLEVYTMSKDDQSEQDPNLIIRRETKSYLFGSKSTLRSSNDELSQAGSSSILNDVDMVDPAPILADKLQKLTQRLGSTAITPVKPKKKMVYIPSGFESDLPNFTKYNGFN